MTNYEQDQGQGLKEFCIRLEWRSRICQVKQKGNQNSWHIAWRRQFV